MGQNLEEQTTTEDQEEIQHTSPLIRINLTIMRRIIAGTTMVKNTYNDKK